MGFSVFVPFGDNEKSDMLVEINGEFKRIQCKTSEKMKVGYFDLDISRSMGHKVSVKFPYTSTEVDYFSCYNIESKTLVLIPIEHVEGQKRLRIRLEEVENHNQYKLKIFSDYTFEKHLRDICRPHGRKTFGGSSPSSWTY